MRNGFALLTSAEDISYEQTADDLTRQKRLIEQVRIVYRRDDLTDPLTLGQVETLALPFESYKLAFTPGLLQQVFRRDGHTLLSNPADVLGGQGNDRGGYVDLEGNAHWWIPSGRVFYSPTANDPSASELTFALPIFFCRIVIAIRSIPLSSTLRPPLPMTITHYL